MAHATVASLMRTIESLLISNSPMESLICDHREEFLALHEKVSSLEVFLKNFEKNNVSREMKDFEVEVKEVANVVEYTIQLRLTEILLGQVAADTATSSRGHSRTHELLSGSLQQVGEDIDRVWKESTKLQDKGKQVSRESLVQGFSSSTKNILNDKSNMVGRQDQREQLLDLIRDYSGEPKVISVIGMGGIGKTTLAREVYNDVSIQSHFDVCAWATLSQQPNIKEILLSLLRSTKGDIFGMHDEAELRDMLQKSLKRKRYLIVMDDIWSSEVWDDLKLCFPSEDNAGSRILLTTRSNEVACYAGSENLSLQMGFMDQDESWYLFKSAAFVNEALPSEFETVGKQIAEECHGVPLTIVVVAGLLKSKRTIEDWKTVADDVKSFLANDPDEQCSRVLGLSYNHLTSDLKACLLYFGIFPEDFEVPLKDLMRFWMAEGFLNLEKDMEGEAGKCLQELVDRCLVIVIKRSRDGTRIRSCKVHDLIYDLCLREIKRGNVFVMNDIVFKRSGVSVCVPSECQSLSKDLPYSHYRSLLIPGHHWLTDADNNNHLERTHSIFYSFDRRPVRSYTVGSELICFKLLKVVDLTKKELAYFPLEILSLIWLRYLALWFDNDLLIPRDIWRLWNLQTFIVIGWSRTMVLFPEEIWGLMQLRHLTNMNTFNSLILPYRPSISVDRGKIMGLSNIQTVSGLAPHCCTKEVILGIRNVKKLGIEGTMPNDYESFWNNLVHLHQLESLSLKNVSSFCNLRWPDFSSAKAFPATLKKLKLEYTKLIWSNLDILAELPNLEVLKLKTACHGEEWDPNVRIFTRLKLLLIQSLGLKYWKATNDNFPVLERLFIKDCRYMEEMPIEFAEIHSLQLIELEYCTPELHASAARMQQEQEDIGNNPVVVRIIKPRRPDDWW